MKDVIERFLKDEIASQELYENVLNFITSFHIRNGEFEANYFIIKKMDQDDFSIYPENIYPDNHREIPYSASIYRDELITKINKHAAKQGLLLLTSD